MRRKRFPRERKGSKRAEGWSCKQQNSTGPPPQMKTTTNSRQEWGEPGAEGSGSPEKGASWDSRELNPSTQAGLSQVQGEGTRSAPGSGSQAALACSRGLSGAEPHSPPQRDAQQPRHGQRQQQHPPVSDEVSKQWQQHVAKCKKYAHS